MPNPPPDTPSCRDPFDVPFLELAVVGDEDFLITGDSDLLKLADKVAYTIVNAANFLAAFDDA